MSLKQIIHEQQLLKSGAVDIAVEIAEEPLAYSIKYPVGKRVLGLNFWRDKGLRSFLKCAVKNYIRSKIPVVFVVTFYVTPPSNVKLSKRDLKREDIPAVFSFELCDYLLSFLEMCRCALFNSYRQIVRVEMDKYYSDKPRTIFKFMKWDHYVKLYQITPTYNPEGQIISSSGQMESIQPKRKRNDRPKRSSEEPIERDEAASFLGGVADHNSLPDTMSQINTRLEETQTT